LSGILAVGASSAIRAAASRRPALAVTIDDFDLAETPLFTGAERDARIREILAKHRIKAAGFVAGKYVKGPVADEVLGAWSRENHIIGNHSFSHGYYEAGDPDAYMADILKCETLLSP
jgi:peptidoglycan/xylan/chitin deacetylase (PgdA/CDA1 family)